MRTMPNIHVCGTGDFSRALVPQPAIVVPEDVSTAVAENRVRREPDLRGSGVEARI